ncbi:MAG: putative histone deacetylase protein [Streblomastix strix]|uniref:Putative histone deacetylase protein n=1 Tax=Streblomastix strix TaxID=222440 RepID=A0A5J4TZI2_9EUKA|nr:MAG: putative histone deacetylase protein [Streblomastix strix]
MALQEAFSQTDRVMIVSFHKKNDGWQDGGYELHIGSQIKLNKTKGHGRCINYVLSLNKPLLLLGGGGYSNSNTARCWTYETALAAQMEISNQIPTEMFYYNDFAPIFELHTQKKQTENLNSQIYIKKILDQAMEYLEIVQQERDEKKKLSDDFLVGIAKRAAAAMVGNINGQQ